MLGGNINIAVPLKTKKTFGFYNFSLPTQC